MQVRHMNKIKIIKIIHWLKAEETALLISGLKCPVKTDVTIFEVTVMHIRLRLTYI